MKLCITIAAALTLAWFAPRATAQNAPLHGLVSRGVKAVVEDLRPQAEAAAGRKTALQYSSSTDFKARIEAGEAFDVAIVSTELMDDLIKAGRVVAGTRVEVARAGIGVGIRTGTAKPDIRTSDALKQALLKAKSITYALDGASRPHLERMFDRMGIKADMAHKTILEQGSERSAARVVDGSADMLLTLISEILPVKGMELVGPLPAEHQSFVAFSGGVGTKASDAAAAKKFVQFFTKADVLPVLKAKGMEPASGKADSTKLR